MFKKRITVDKHSKSIYGVMDNDSVKLMNDEICNTMPNWMMWETIGIKGLQEVNPFIQCHMIPFIAQAECDARDEFNEEIGKAIVACKLDIKREERIGREYYRLADEIEELVNRLNDLGAGHMQKATQFRKQLSRILDRVKELED